MIPSPDLSSLFHPVANLPQGNHGDRSREAMVGGNEAATARVCDPDLALKQKQPEFVQHPGAVDSRENCWFWEQGLKELVKAQRNSGSAIDRRVLALPLASLAIPSATLPNPLTFQCRPHPAPELQEAYRSEAGGPLQFPGGPESPAARTQELMRGTQSCGLGCAIALKL